MESLLKLGKFIEVGSEEWRVHIIQEKVRIRESIESLQKEVDMLRDYLASLIQLEISK